MKKNIPKNVLRYAYNKAKRIEKRHQNKKKLRKKSKNDGMEILSDVYKKFCEQEENKKEIVAGKLFIEWEKIVGESIAKNIRYSHINLQKKALYVQAKSSVWATQVKMFEKEITKKINAFLDEELVKSIFVSETIKK